MAAEEFSTQGILFGLEGVDLKRTLDLIKPTRCARLTNVQRTEEGALIGRGGPIPIVTAGAGTTLHSIISLNGHDAAGVSTHHFVVIVDDDIYWGTSGGIALQFPPVGTASPIPIIMCPVTYPDSTNTFEGLWAIIPVPTNTGNFTQANFIIRESDGVVSNLGVFEPAILNVIGDTAVSVVLATANTTTIDNCDVAGWTNNAGTGGAPANAADAVIKKQGAASLKLTTNAGGAPGLYYNFWNKANALNLNTVGAAAASDDDIIHLWIMTDRPDLITEFRIYFVVAAAAFDLNTVPGTSATLNTDAYYKSFRPSDFTPIYEVTSSTTPVATTTNATLTALNQLPVTPTVNPDLALLNAEQDPSIRASVQMAGGRGAWQEVGIIGYPLRRGDFGRIGTDSTRTWGNVTGLVLAAQINTNAVANIWLDDIFLTGGAGPDTSPVGATQYDYRTTEFCVDRGEEGNPSDIQVPGLIPAFAPHDALRRGLVVTPAGYGHGTVGLTMRQKFYRRGGTLGNNWYFVGMNTADGATLTDTLSDLEIVAAPTLEIDNDVPPFMSSIWGPVNGIMFGCTGNITPAGFLSAGGEGGTLFWSKVDRPGNWPASYTYEVCSISEELMAGFTHAGQGYVFSRENLYTHTPDLSNAAIMNVVPTQCKKGLGVSRIAFCTDKAGVYFLAKDGIFFSPGPGGAERNITDDFLEPLFLNQRKSGYQPIDWTQAQSIALEMHDSELWFTFAGLGTEIVGSVSGIIGDGTGPASGHVGAFGFALLCDDNSTNSLSVQADGNGVWLITNVPVGTYTLVIFDALDQAYRRSIGAVTVTENTLTNSGTRTLNTLGAHPACTGVGPPPSGELSEIQVWIFNTLYQYWRHHSYSVSPARFYHEPGPVTSEGSRLLVGTQGPPPQLGEIPSSVLFQFDFASALADCHIRTGALDQGIPRVSKLYGDAFIDVDVRSNTGVTVTPYINSEAQALTPTTITPVGTGRERFYIPIDEILARNISLDISWTPDSGLNDSTPIIYQGGVSYTPQPDTTETRVTNWDTQGRLNDKWVKGILFEVDTGGLPKNLNILADGAVVRNITLQAAGRQVLQFSWPEFKGRILRTAPTDTVQWITYDMRWIFDEEPLELLRWESQEVDHGFHGQQVPLYGLISLRSQSAVNLQLTTFRQDGTSMVRNYTIASTANAKQKAFVPFEATRGVLFKYLFTAEIAFALYREESTVRVQPWGTSDPIEVAPFGNDDLDMPMRSMVDAGQASVRSGAGHR